MNRKVIPLSDGFFNDGYWYVLTSTSLGGNKYSLNEIEKILREPVDSNDENALEATRNLLREGVCLPLFFDGDCALDRAVIVVGDLSETEEAEWIGRLQGKLEIPDGEFVVMGGGLLEDVEVMIQNLEPPDPNFHFFQKVKVEPSTYCVEIYAFLPSLTVNLLWEDWLDRQRLTPEERMLVEEPLAQWWQRTRPDEAQPEWLEAYLEEEYIDGEEYDLLEYIIRLTPLSEEIDIPPLEESTHWCGVFEIRKPELCPRGIIRSLI